MNWVQSWAPKMGRATQPAACWPVTSYHGPLSPPLSPADHRRAPAAPGHVCPRSVQRGQPQGPLLWAGARGREHAAHAAGRRLVRTARPRGSRLAPGRALRPPPRADSDGAGCAGDGAGGGRGGRCGGRAGHAGEPARPFLGEEPWVLGRSNKWVRHRKGWGCESPASVPTVSAEPSHACTLTTHPELPFPPLPAKGFWPGLDGAGGGARVPGQAAALGGGRTRARGRPRRVAGGLPRLAIPAVHAAVPLDSPPGHRR